VGKGKHPDAEKAALQAAEECRSQLGIRRPDFLVLLSSVAYNQQTILDTIRREFPDVPLIGCSTAGEIYASGPDEGTVALAGLSGVQARLAMGGTLVQGSFDAGLELGRKLSNEPGKAVMVFSDGLEGDGAAVVRGLQEGIGKILPTIGGAAGDDNRYEKTFVYLDGNVVSGKVIGASLDGDFHFGVGVRHGWQPVGRAVQVTRSDGSRLIEINGKPAIRFFQDYFGEYTSRLEKEPMGRLAIYYPLGLAVPDSDEYLLRAPLSMEPGGAVKCTAEIPEGTRVRLMIGSVEKALQAARIAAMEALSQMEGRLPQLAILFNCTARRRLFGVQAGQEIQAVSDILGRKVPVIGLYTYGEIASCEGDKTRPSCFHNETVVILTIG
jgi:hypothetical protein